MTRRQRWPLPSARAPARRGRSSPRRRSTGRPRRRRVRVARERQLGVHRLDVDFSRDRLTGASDSVRASTRVGHEDRPYLLVTELHGTAQAAHSVQIIMPLLSLASWLRWWTRKHRPHVNSSACLGRTRTDSSSPDRSAPGSSKPSACSVSSTSTLDEVLSTRRDFSSSDGVLVELVVGLAARHNQLPSCCLASAS